MLEPIDYDRGVIIKIIPSASGAFGAGSHVCMYVDSPGAYYAPNGLPISPEWARKAGFDVDADLKERQRLEKRASALAAVDREFDTMSEGEIVQEDDDFQIIHMGHGWFDVLNKDGARVNDRRLRRDEASDLVKSLLVGKAHVEGLNG